MHGKKCQFESDETTEIQENKKLKLDPEVLAQMQRDKVAYKLAYAALSHEENSKNTELQKEAKNHEFDYDQIIADPSDFLVPVLRRFIDAGLDTNHPNEVRSIYLDYIINILSADIYTTLSAFSQDFGYNQILLKIYLNNPDIFSYRDFCGWLGDLEGNEAIRIKIWQITTHPDIYIQLCDYYTTEAQIFLLDTQKTEQLRQQAQSLGSTSAIKKYQACLDKNNTLLMMRLSSALHHIPRIEPELNDRMITYIKQLLDHLGSAINLVDGTSKNTVIHKYMISLSQPISNIGNVNSFNNSLISRAMKLMIEQGINIYYHNKNGKTVYGLITDCYHNALQQNTPHHTNHITSLYNLFKQIEDDRKKFNKNPQDYFATNKEASLTSELSPVIFLNFGLRSAQRGDICNALLDADIKINQLYDEYKKTPARLVKDDEWHALFWGYKLMRYQQTELSDCIITFSS